MKIFVKIVAIALGVTLLGSLAACKQPPSAPDFDDAKPWSTEQGFEQANYTVERFRMKKDGKNTVQDGDPVATGTVTMTVQNHRSDRDLFEATVDYKLTYVDEERAGADKGLTDTIATRSVFRKIGLGPVSSERVLTLADREGVDNRSHTITADYTQGSATMTRPGWTEPKDMTFSQTGAIFDNEQVYFLIRACSTVIADKSASFTLVNWYDCFHNASYSTYPMSISCAKERETLYIGSFATQFGLEAADNDRAKVDCLKGTLSKTDSYPGPSQTIWFSTKPFTVNTTETTQKVIIRILTREYDANAVETYNNVYTLTGYTVTKA